MQIWDHLQLNYSMFVRQNSQKVRMFTQQNCVNFEHTVMKKIEIGDLKSYTHNLINILFK